MFGAGQQAKKHCQIVWQTGLQVHMWHMFNFADLMRKFEGNLAKFAMTGANFHVTLVEPSWSFANFNGPSWNLA